MYRIVITPPKVSESQKVADAELQFADTLAGLSLVGFSIWNNNEDGYRVSFPTRRYQSTGRRRSYLLLRATDPDERTTYDRLQHEILDAYYVFAGLPVGAAS